MKLPYTKQEDYLIPNIMIDMCFVLLNRNSIICLFCQLKISHFSKYFPSPI